MLRFCFGNNQAEYRSAAARGGIICSTLLDHEIRVSLSIMFMYIKTNCLFLFSYA